MKAEFLSLGTDLYQVNSDKIIVYNAENIENRHDGTLRIKVRYENYYAKLKDNVLHNEFGNVLYLDFSDAQKRQLEIRKNIIDSAFEKMCKSKEEYEEIILEFKDKPATNLNEVIR